MFKIKGETGRMYMYFNDVFKYINPFLQTINMTLLSIYSLKERSLHALCEIKSINMDNCNNTGNHYNCITHFETLNNLLMNLYLQSTFY